MLGTTVADSSQLGLRTDGASASENKLLGLIASGLIGTLAFAQPLGAEELVPHARYFSGEAYSELASYVEQLEGERLSIDSPHTSPHNFTPIDEQAYAALRNFVQQSGAGQHDPVSRSRLTHHSAPAGDEYLALQSFVREIGGEASAPGEAKQLLLAAGEQPKTAAPAKAKAAKPVKPIIADDGSYVGQQVCLGCHAGQAASFGLTLMGKIFRNPRNAQEARGCETCHGPGSLHLKAVGCASCHGDGGISSRPGMPSLVGQDPQYLVPAMKAYVTGQRKHSLMRVVLSGVGDAELNNIAVYYARQIPERAHTPLVGDPSAGKGATGLCAECHGEQGISLVPAWPSLAGQDAQYLADAMRAYQHGSRTKTIACAACHGARGISRQAGMPSLVGQDPQYLVLAMKAYVDGERKHRVMTALLTGVSDSELRNMATYYAGQVPSRAQTPRVGDTSAGKSAAATCVECHGTGHGAADPAWPSLAGQDSQFLAHAIRAYKEGSRNKVVACAACHGAGGISKRSGMPSLVGLDPQYLVSAMKAYVSGQRKGPVMKALLAGVSDTELSNMAQFYARQTPARAQTPTIGDPSAGKTASASCAGCHGEQGVSSNPAWPSLAGQDARYLADALKAYKDGSRTDATMKALVASLDDRTINDIASYYAGLRPGQPSATGAASRSDPVLVANGLVASLDERTIDNVASYFASLQPEQPAGAQSAAGMRDPVLVRNNLLAGLSEGTINNVASYYATLHPAQPASAKNAPARPVPARVGTAAPTDGHNLAILSFRLDDPTHTADEFNEVCLGCHEKGNRTLWRGSSHETRGLACVNCHTVMRNVTPKFQLAKLTEMDTCFQCHKNQRAAIWRSSHMPVREGKMTCSSCHNPHGSFGEALLKTATVNDTCYKCHAEKRGPFLWEHPPVREDCLNCHDPHGSMHDAMLKVSRPRLCQQCHTAADHPGNPANPRAIYAIAGACSNCHVKIHGSNSPAGSQLVR